MIQQALQGYDGTRAYRSVATGMIPAADLAALRAAGMPGPYLAADAPGPPPSELQDLVDDNSPVDRANAAAGAVTDDDVTRAELPSGRLLFQVDNLPGGEREDFIVDRSGRFVAVSRYGTGNTVHSEITGRGAGVDLGMPDGDVVTEAAPGGALASLSAARCADRAGEAWWPRVPRS